MAEFKFLNATRLRANDMITDTRSYMSRLYGRTSELFTTASPFSQILDVLSEITKLIFFYIEDATVEQNILTAQNPVPEKDNALFAKLGLEREVLV